eukprot:GSMAST32.ASY1.ANO1.2484.1 assembled CDS
MTSAQARVKSIIGESHFFEETINFGLVKKLLDSKAGASGDAEKIEGMKWLLAQISKGRDVSQFFSSVVKTVSAKSIELKHSNQLIRALSLRVLTSIRVREIIQIQLIAVKQCVTDASAYVRKTAAHGVAKLFKLDQSQKDVLIESIKTLLADKEPMVLSSAVAAFVEVCPDRYDLLHQNFRKLCQLVADLDEWSQMLLMNILLCYALPSNSNVPQSALLTSHNIPYKKPISLNEFYAQSGESSDGEDLITEKRKTTKKLKNKISDVEYSMNEDHKLLLRAILPLLMSRNSGVVLEVATLYFYLGCRSPALCDKAAKAVTRQLYVCFIFFQIRIFFVRNFV